MSTQLLSISFYLYRENGTCKYDEMYLGNLVENRRAEFINEGKIYAYPFVLLDISLTVKAAPHECVIRTSQP